jgi:cell division protein FtsI/penicillin-binding protein 2
MVKHSMAAKAHQSFHTRVYILIAGLLVWSFILAFRLVNLQLFQYIDLSKRAKRQQNRVFEISPKRGTIYDRRNRELAVSINVESVFAVPTEVPTKDQAASQLARALNLNRADVLRKLTSSHSFAWLKRKADYAEVAAVKSLQLPGIYFEKESKRFYPKRELASPAIGCVGTDNDGLSGLEFAYDKLVRGQPGQALLMTDARQRTFSSIERAPTAGQDLVLTIDEYIQYLVEQELSSQVKKSQAIGGTAVVMDPHSGEILAMASLPTFNPNQYWKYPSETWRNRAILSVYEPGSTFKIITAATALEEHLATPEEPIDCRGGAIVVGGRRIRDHKAYGVLSVREVVAHSSNVGAIQLGFRIGKERFERYIRSFGFGSPTDVDLPGESKGLLKPASQWPAVTLATISMGQGIGVTPLQLLTAVSSIANGGYLVRPHIVQQVNAGGVQRISFEPERIRKRVLSMETTQQLKDMLTSVITAGTGKEAQLEGFTAAGKTGTAQKIEANGRYSHSKFISSFVGFAPLENPAIAVVVTVDEPRGQYYGGQVAAPVFRNIAEKTLRYLSIPPDQPLTSLQLAKLRRQEKEAMGDPDIEQPGLMDADWEAEVVPAIDRETVEPTQSHLTTSSEEEYNSFDIEGANSVKVPDLSGKSLRTVVSELSALGLQVKAHGSGLVTEQFPSPGTGVIPGSKISIQFSRHNF